MKTYVVGHKNPDTDAIVSAIALAELEGYIPARPGELNKETIYVLDSFKVPLPELLPKTKKKVVLVDNNGSDEELVEGVHPDEIIAIYDHHKLCGFKTIEPVTVLIEPVGATATIISDLYGLRGKVPSPQVASLLLAGIISDTLNFISPITTERDRLAAESLNWAADIKMDKLAKGMFAAKSDIAEIKTKDLITKDYKVYEMGSLRVGIGVWETVLPEVVLARKAEIVEALRAEKQKSQLDHIYFAVVDIMHQTAYLIISSEEERQLATHVFKGKIKDDILVLPGIVSRKKQIVPPLEKELGKK